MIYFNTQSSNNPVLNSTEMMSIDDTAISHFHIPSIVLMTEAGRQSSLIIKEKFPLEIYKNVLVVCGTGNNGGDGFVIARFLQQAGYQVTVLLTKPENHIRAEAIQAFLPLQALKVEYVVFDPSEQLPKSDLIIDAILGTGLTSEVNGTLANLIQKINDSQKPVVAIDIPSGLSCQHFRLQPSIKADITITFGYAKLSQLHPPSALQIGDLYIVDIGFPKEAFAKVKNQRQIITAELVQEIYPLRPIFAHKGSFGHVLVIGGSVGMSGAALLAGEAALTCGSGLVSVILPGACRNSLPAYPANLMVKSLAGEDDYFTDQHTDYIQSFIVEKKITSIALGMGIGKHPLTKRFLKELLKSLTIPVVIDADALSIIPEITFNPNSSWVLTPHPGEYQRSLNQPCIEESLSPDEDLFNYCQQTQMHLVYKSARTLISTPNRELFINIQGNSGMASAGMGDVLAGMICSLLGQQLPPKEASIIAVYWHARAGDLSMKEYGQEATQATTVLKQLPFAIKDVTRRIK